MTVDPARYPRVGLQSYPETLPLNDKEVVLTFDDGPRPPTTAAILDALAKECVKATFFVVGTNAKAYPVLLRRMADEGHTVAYHTMSHPNLGKISHAEALTQINDGFTATDRALTGRSDVAPITPFFRFPYFETTPALLENLEKRGIAVFGADFWASDWNPMTPDQQFRLIVERLERHRKGIILFHDIKAQTAAMLPEFLRYLRSNRYTVVHIAPQPAGNTAVNGRSH